MNQQKDSSYVLSSGVEKDRLEKLSLLNQLGISPYPYSFQVTHALDELRVAFQSLVDSETVVSIASRVMAQRSAGKLIFLDLAATAEQIRKSYKIQIMVRKNEVSSDSWAIMESLSLGDWIGVEGKCIYTRTGEPTIQAQVVTMLCKSLRPIPTPKVYEGEDGEVKDAYAVQDIELLWRYPEIDMMTRRKAEVMVARSQVLTSIRNTLVQEYNCIELETPFLNNYFGGAEATPFITHLKALDQEVFLAISPEIELKRAVVGGLGSGGNLGEGVFYIARNFRNEGVDRTHNPEFTAMEAYVPFVDYHFMMEMTEKIYANACQAVHGEPICRTSNHNLDFGKPWPRLKMTSLVKEISGIDVEHWSTDEIRSEIKRRELHTGHKIDHLSSCQLKELLKQTHIAQFYSYIEKMTDEELRKIALSHGLHQGIFLEQEWDFLVLDLFDLYCEHQLVEPCHVILHPAKSTVLCKEYREGPLPNGHVLIERFESFALGMELSNAYSELNNPIIQRRLVEEQAKARELGKEDAMPHNELFLRSIEMGLPPCGGLGIGIDRMVMLLTNSQAIRDVIAFPVLRRSD